MKIEIMIAVLGIICIGALAAVFVLWAKIDEQKQKTADEHANYIAALNLHNTTAEHAQWFEEAREYSMRIDEKALEIEIRRRADVERERDALQDRLSAILCPHNDHVWKDGVCVKCGRVKNALP